MSSEQGVSSSTANTSSNFQAGRQNVPDHLGHTFDNPMQMFSIKQQQPMASSVTGTVYTGPPAKYLNNNNNSYMRTMVPQQKYMTYNGSNMGQQQQQQQQQRRQYNNTNNNNGADNASNDSVK